MVTFTNKHGAPKTLVNLLSRDSYSRGASRISVTQLIAPPRIGLLRAKHDAEIEVDVSDSLWMLFGRALHVVAEQGADEEHIPEERLYAEVNGWVVSGAMDVQKLGEASAKIVDYKMCAAWAVMHDKPDWEKQLNCYAWLLRKVKGWTIDGLEICAFVRDWSRHEVGRRDYPEAPVHVVPVRLWTPREQERYIEERVKLHQEAARAAEWEDALPECTPEERWERPSRWAVKRPANKKATAIYDNQWDAEKDKAARGTGYVVEERPSEPVRCSGNYCGVNQFCQQWQDDPRRTV